VKSKAEVGRVANELGPFPAAEKSKNVEI